VDADAEGHVSIERQAPAEPERAPVKAG
jgi:hypothetical protein